MVSWDDTQTLLSKLNQASPQEGMTFGLPTEAQWEYACRAGTTTFWHCGDSDAPLEDYAWFSANAGETTKPVGKLKANAWGLHDMYGNVWEWCADCFAADYYGQSPAEDPSCPPTSDRRSIRGGSWKYPNARVCRSAERGGHPPWHPDWGNGLRLSATIEGTEPGIASARN
jgi:formylglycine-generating enzyme required for sulfatase activity